MGPAEANFSISTDGRTDMTKHFVNYAPALPDLAHLSAQ